MKMFSWKEIKEARAYARDGNQALHVYPSKMVHAPDAPAVFKRHSTWAHLFDMDKIRLIVTAQELGVRVIKVEREGTDRQHIDLCGKPLERAIQMCERDGEGGKDGGKTPDAKGPVRRAARVRRSR